jgi:dTDP-glucose pyrophosphorylase
MNKNECGIILVADEEKRLIATITDGDIRREILKNSNLDVIIHNYLKNHIHPQPTVAKVGTDNETLLRLMHEKVLRQIPIVDEENKIVDLIIMDDLVAKSDSGIQAMIMAGGYGTRLYPLTKDVPKPMLPIGGKPLMEWMIDQLHDSGITEVKISTHYLSEKISGYFGNGDAHGVNISYINEESPLGTAGSIPCVDSIEKLILVINGDILTDVNFQAMEMFHREHGADLTVGVIQYEIQLPYGVIETENEHIINIKEKPSYNYLVNAGIYLLSPSVLDYIPSGISSTMTDLIETLIYQKKKVISFPIFEYWVDIGKHADYLKARHDIENGSVPEIY